MTTYTHQLAEGNVRSGFLSGSAGIEYRSATFNLTADQVADGNIMEFFRIPGDAIVVDGYLKVDQLDTDDTGTLTVDVGHDGTTDAFLDGDTTAQSGGTAQFGSTPLLPRDPTDPTTNDNDPFSPAEEGTVISARFATAAATAAAGDITLIIGYVRTP